VLVGLLLDSERSQFDILSTLSPEEVDVPIDNYGHTALHWAAALSRISLLRALIAAGASPYRINTYGHTALMRACVVGDSMRHKSFSQLLDVLGDTLHIRDSTGRTVLHHIATAPRAANNAREYYLESLVLWVEQKGIARFKTEILNAQDNSGNTALNLAVKNGNQSVIRQLLEVGADPFFGQSPADSGIGGTQLPARIARRRHSFGL
jgi:ankyrin repeat protein